MSQGYRRSALKAKNSRPLLPDNFGEVGHLQEWVAYMMYGASSKEWNDIVEAINIANFAKEKH